VNAAIVWLGVSLSAGLLVACGSSANDKHGASSDSGAGGDRALTSDGAQQCTAFGAPGCGKGKTCCLSGLSGTCEDLSSCSSSVQFECQSRGSCAAGEVCCAAIPLDQAIDASALSPEGGLVALGVTTTSFCSGSCSPPHFSLCATGSDCAGGAACDMLPEGNPILLALGAETLTACAPPDGGASLSTSP
jgi:hypothetical protein